MLNITFHAQSFEMTDAIKSYLEKKLMMLNKLVEVPTADDMCEVRIRREAPDHHKQGNDIYHVDITITSSGQTYRADADTHDIYASIDEVKDELEQMVRTQQKTFRDDERRGALAAKEMIRDIEE